LYVEPSRNGPQSSRSRSRERQYIPQRGNASKYNTGRERHETVVSHESRNHFQCLKPGCNNAWAAPPHLKLSVCKKCSSKVWAIECLNLQTQTSSFVQTKTHHSNMRHGQERPRDDLQQTHANKSQHLSTWKNVIVDASHTSSRGPKRVEKPLCW
jgi:hypothetical protein